MDAITLLKEDQWGAKFKVMKENIEHHATLEEEGKLFPKVRRAFTAEELKDMGTRMLELKESAQSEAKEEERAGR